MRKDTGNVIMRAFIAIAFSTWSMFYLWRITFITEGEYLSQYTGEILGFTMGTAVSTILGFYFSGQKLPDGRRKTDYGIEQNGNGNGGTDHK